MKTHPTVHGLVALSAVLALIAPLRSADTPAPAPRVDVAFDNPENFTDWELSCGPDWYRHDIFAALSSYLVKVTDPMLPAGYNLKITFTDIDLGHRSSRHEPSASGAPVFEFDYVVADSTGTVVRKGSENLRHYWDFGNYLGTIETADTAGVRLRFEKAILKNWADTKLADLKKA